MTPTDRIPYLSKMLRCSSMDDAMNKKDQHGKFKRFNASLWNLLSPYRQSNNHFQEHHTNTQSSRQDSFLQPLSELSRSVSNKSVTFALVFDEVEEMTEDLVIVLPDKNPNHPEPYPFRSEIPACSLPKSNSSTNLVKSSSRSKKKVLQQLIHPYRRKKLRQLVDTTQPTTKMNRSTSTPMMTCSLTSPLTINNHRWFQLPSLTRFLQTFIKHPKRPTNTKHVKPRSPLQSTTLRKYSEIIY